ncbi:MAG: sigma-70 family RNA polymerase sigma factor [Burkholderiaceae bacterium]|jgi:RNA polymerase sigma-70 factor (ECF subfamily)
MTNPRDQTDSDMGAQLAPLRPHLVRFARLQLRNDAWAEDVVSETLIAVLEKPGAFAGQSSLKTYVIGILKHKIIDYLRGVRREVQIEAGEDEAEGDAFDKLFATDGHFRDPPPNWGDPHAALERQEFFDVLQVCVERLPVAIARVFMMREWLDLETDEICKELAISTSNCWVMLYRARMRLRECLQLNWFGDLPKVTPT